MANRSDAALERLHDLAGTTCCASVLLFLASAIVGLGAREWSFHVPFACVTLVAAFAALALGASMEPYGDR
jgi:hypothetical protein